MPVDSFRLLHRRFAKALEKANRRHLDASQLTAQIAFYCQKIGDRHKEAAMFNTLADL